METGEFSAWGLWLLIAIGIALWAWGFFALRSRLRKRGFLRLSLVIPFFLGGIWLLIMAALALANRRRQTKTEDHLATGQRGEAVILSLNPTGVKINDQPRVKMQLEVHVNGHPPYKVKKKVTMSQSHLSRLQVGSIVPVVADPNEPRNPMKVGLLLT